jgi:hypothetical protein
MMTLRTTRPTARKAHRCGWCYGQIQPGETYSRSTNIYDDHVYDWVACAACEAIANIVWAWAGQPDEGMDEDSFAEWAHDNRDLDDRARAYLTRRGCTCETCPLPPAEGREATS